MVLMVPQVEVTTVMAYACIHYPLKNFELKIASHLLHLVTIPTVPLAVQTA